MRSNPFCLVAAFSVLLASVAVTAILALKNAGIPETGFNYEPNLEGWEVKELPIGPNELLEEVTEAILGFSYCRNFRFQRRSECFEVFLAFWEKGNVSEREVAGHTPEICYTRQGLNLDRKSEISNRTIDIPMWLLEFSHLGETLSLVYFHLADNRVVRHGRSGSPEFSTYLRRLLSGELSFKKRQLLVRLTFPCSSMPAECIRNHPEMEKLIADILTAYSPLKDVRS